MLVSLAVQNFAIIDNLQIDFSSGMTVLTGETGAGKSLIIDAIGLLFGKRASNDMIRFGENKATIEGVFSHLSPETICFLEQLGIDIQDDDLLIIKRELYASGKSICRVNNIAITLNQLQEMCELIGDIHTQNDTIGLINPKNYLKFLSYPSYSVDLKTYENALKLFKEADKKYQSLLKQATESKEKEDFLLYQFKEFKQANLDLQEEASLKQEVSYLENFEKISENLQEFDDIYQKQAILEHMYHSIQVLSKLEKFNNEFTSIRTSLEELYYSLEELVNHPQLKMNRIDFDYQRLDEINQRLGIYSDFRRKYKKEIPEIIAYFEKIKSELDLIENYDMYLKEYYNERTIAYDKTRAIAQQIRNHRIEASSKLVEQVKLHLQDLQLKNVRFEIAFNALSNENIVFKNDGIDEVEFLVSFNKGEPVKPLSKVASGGEMSRFMLALKTVFGHSLPLQTKIFDEIDHGVSGAIAYSIAQKMKTISNDSQVLCITHLPQVASICDSHFKISKAIDQNRTYTLIKALNEEEKIIEIARMISKGEPTVASLNLAKELRGHTSL